MYIITVLYLVQFLGDENEKNKFKKVVDRLTSLCYSEECYIMARICLFISNRKQDHVVK